MTVTDETTAEWLRTAARLTDEHLVTMPVEGPLGVVVEDITEHTLRLKMPLPRGNGLPDPLGVATALCVLTDSAAGIAAARVRPHGQGGATVELRLDHASPPDPKARLLLAEARVLHAAAGTEFAEAVVSDDLGRVLVRAHGHFARFGSASPRQDPPPEHERPARVAALYQALTADLDGDPARRSVPLPECLSNPRGQIHGGIAMAIAELAQRDVRIADNPEDAPPPTLLSMQMEYLRPVACDGTPLDCVTRYERRGKRFSTLRTELVRTDGRLAATATGLWSTLA